jgi:endo-1,4-beta-mannosidase
LPTTKLKNSLLILTLSLTACLTTGCNSDLFWFLGSDKVSTIVQRRESGLVDQGRPYRFLGVNVYSLASHPPGDGYECGRTFTDEQLHQTFRDLAAMGANAVRLDAYQSFTAGGQDYSRLDRIFRLGRRYGIRLILTLENQWSHCTQGGYKRADWYRNGYQRPYGAYRQSYVEHVVGLVTRYRDEPALLMWQLMNEPESFRANGRPDWTALKRFSDRMIRAIRRIDRRHLICLGSSGVSRWRGGPVWYRILLNSGSDIAEAHDYGLPTVAWPPVIRDSWRVAHESRKPFFVGEVGIPLKPPVSQAKRAAQTIAKLKAAWAHGVDGILVWSYDANDGTKRDFDRSDRLYREFQRFARGKTLPTRPDD